MTELCQLEGHALKWQLAYIGPKVGYFGHSGVVSVEVLDSQLPKYWTLCQQMGDSVLLSELYFW